MAIKVDGLAEAVSGALAEYGDGVRKAVAAAVKDSAKVCRDELERTSPERSGLYARAWKSGYGYDGKSVVSAQVYNKDSYQLTHLLEYGHNSPRNGGARAYPHIQKAADKAAAILEKNITLEVGKT